MSPITSTAVRFHEHGEPLDVLRDDRVEVVDPPAGRVRVDVVAVGLNPADWELCRGFLAGDLPRGIGYDVAGTIDAVGPGVDGIAVGDVVFGTADFRGQPSAGVAEVAILDSWYPLPEGLDAVRAAVLPMVTITAVWTLDALGVGDETTLVVNGAGAMAGFACVQLARRRGARVIATAGPTFADELAAFGAEVTSYGEGMAERVRALLGDGAADALVLDASRPSVGTIAELIAITGDPSRVMTISNHEQARALGAKVNLEHLGSMAPPASFLPQAAELARDGEYRIPVAREFALAQWREAAQLSLSGHPHGKLVLVPGRS